MYRCVAIRPPAEVNLQQIPTSIGGGKTVGDQIGVSGGRSQWETEGRIGRAEGGWQAGWN